MHQVWIFCTLLAICVQHISQVEANNDSSYSMLGENETDHAKIGLLYSMLGENETGHADDGFIYSLLGENETDHADNDYIEFIPIDSVTPIIAPGSEEIFNITGSEEISNVTDQEEQSEQTDEVDGGSSNATESEEIIIHTLSEESGSGSYPDLESGEDPEDLFGSGSGSGSREGSGKPDFSFDSSSEESEEDSGLKSMCTHTAKEPFPWWQVDLQEPKVIAQVKIFNRAQGYNDQLHQIYIGVGNTSMEHQSQPATNVSGECWMQESPLPPGLSHFSCAEPIKGRYVTVQLLSAQAVLTLCEVQVFELEMHHNGNMIPKEENVAANKPAVQSSTEWEGTAEKAVDGQISAQYYAAAENLHCLVSPGDQNNRILNQNDALMHNKVYADCAVLHDKGYTQTGVYFIGPNKGSDRREQLLQVYCDMHNDGGGWTTILNRHFYLGHHQDFLHQYTYEYLKGFGDLCLEHWIGVENLHWLTRGEPSSLMVEIVNSYKSEPYTEIYKKFRVDGPENNFTVNFNASKRSEEPSITYFRSDAGCLVDGTPYSIEPGHGGWWWTPEQQSPSYLGPNGKLWIGQNETHPIEWCNYLQLYSGSRQNFYIQSMHMKIRPTNYVVRSNLDGFQ